MSVISDFELRLFVDHIRATKPPYDCPYEQCKKPYRSYNGICSHLTKDHNFTPAIETTSPAKNSTCSGSRGWLKQKGKRRLSATGAHSPLSSANEDRGKGATSPRDPLSFAQNQRLVDVEIDNQICKLNVMEPLEVVIVDEDLPPEKKSPKSPKEVKSSLSPKEPLFRLVENYVPPKPPVHSLLRRGAYVRHLEKTSEEQEEEVEYDMDEEDCAWLSIINERRRKSSVPPITDEAFELLMDRLEKASHFQNQESGLGVDDDAVCCVCNDGEAENTNAILFCDMCNLAVHQECYGVPYIPEGQWLCRRCQMSPSCAVSCVLCPNKGGAFKQTGDGRWAHVICALWVPEVQFANTVFLEPIEGFDRIPPARWRLSCFVCKHRGGACIQCHKPTCYVAFHVTCAQHAGLYMKMEPVHILSQSGPSFSVKKTAFCDAHAPLDDDSSDSASACETVTASQRKQRAQLKIRNARKILAKQRNLTPTVSIPVISKRQLEAISDLVQIDKKQQFFPRLLAYWTMKRESRFGVPLLRRLQVFHQNKRLQQEREETAELQQQAVAWKRLRNDLEHFRLLVELVKNREKEKQKWMTILGRLLELKLKPFTQFVLDVIEKLSAKDPNGVFANPVSEKEVPGYRHIIKKPMDLTTMRKKAYNYGYSTLADVAADFKLMIDNCLRFNPKDSIFHKIALKMRKDGNQLLENAVELEKKNAYDPKSGLHTDDGVFDVIDFLKPSNVSNASSSGQSDTAISITSKLKPPLKKATHRGAANVKMKRKSIPSTKQLSAQGKPKLPVRLEPEEPPSKIARVSLGSARGRGRPKKVSSNVKVSKKLVQQSTQRLARSYRKSVVPASAPALGSRSSRRSMPRDSKKLSDDSEISSEHGVKGNPNAQISQPESFRQFRSNSEHHSLSENEESGPDSKGGDSSDDELSDEPSDVQAGSVGRKKKKPSGGLDKSRRSNAGTTDEEDDDDDDLIQFEPLDLVWAKVKGCSWYPALVIDPKMPRTGYIANGVPIPVPPMPILENVKKRKFESPPLLVLFFDLKRNWGWIERSSIEVFGVDESLDQEKLHFAKHDKERERVRKGFVQAMVHRYKIDGVPLPPGLITEEDGDIDLD